MTFSLEKLAAIESRLSGRVEHLDVHGYRDRADLIDIARRRVARVRERVLLERALSNGKAAA